jgi:hypothetical protein
MMSSLADLSSRPPPNVFTSAPPISVSHLPTSGAREQFDLQGGKQRSSSGSMSFNDLPSDITEHIFSYVFAHADKKESYVRPSYRKGMLHGYIRTGSNLRSDAEDEVFEENIDLRAIQVNKKFADAGRRHFYQNHAFVLRHPAVCKWWVKHIGNQNFENVRKLFLEIYTGFEVPIGVHCSLDLTIEEQWTQFFCWLRPRHKLQTLHIDLEGWQNLYYARDMPEGMKEEIDRCRQDLIDRMGRLRDLVTVRLRDHARRYLSLRNCHHFELLMIQVDKNVGAVDMRNTPLSDVLMELNLSSRVQTRGVAKHDKQKPKQKKNPQGTSTQTRTDGQAPSNMIHRYRN